MKKIISKQLSAFIFLVGFILTISLNSKGQDLNIYDFNTNIGNIKNISLKVEKAFGNQKKEIRLNSIVYNNERYFKLEGLGFTAWLSFFDGSKGLFFTYEGKNPLNNQFNQELFFNLEDAINIYVTYYERGFIPDPLNKAAALHNNNIGAFSDNRDGHVYTWVKIGTQIWMAENLAYLPLDFDSRYSVYNYSGNNFEKAKSSPYFKIYGVLYTWEIANEACPAGWHLPSDIEWQQLEKTMGLSQSIVDDKTSREGTVNGSQLKAANGWSDSLSFFDPFGFSAMPGGVYINEFLGEGEGCCFWSKSQYDDEKSWIRALEDSPKFLRKYRLKDSGFSVRCVKN